MIAMSEHAARVDRYYLHATAEFYLPHWSDEHLHFGAFEPGEAVELDPRPGAPMKDLVRVPVQRMTDAILGPARIEATARVVDAGCGVGGTAIEIARRHGCEVIGVNICAHQLELARHGAAAAGLAQRVRFELADCSVHLPFADASVDVITNIESACHYGDRARFLAECARILKPGGRLVASDWIAAEGISEHDYREHLQPVCELWVLQSLESEAGYRRMLSAAGLTIDEYVDFGDAGLANARIMALKARQYAEVAALVELSPLHQGLFDQSRTLSSAWLGGWFRLQRYAATKPA